MWTGSVPVLETVRRHHYMICEGVNLGFIFHPPQGQALPPGMLGHPVLQVPEPRPHSKGVWLAVLLQAIRQ